MKNKDFRFLFNESDKKGLINRIRRVAASRRVGRKVHKEGRKTEGPEV